FFFTTLLSVLIGLFPYYFLWKSSRQTLSGSLSIIVAPNDDVYSP
ncbi:hypothetical protein KSS87_006910, partial [Heliosperma pusillum]